MEELTPSSPWPIAGVRPLETQWAWTARPEDVVWGSAAMSPIITPEEIGDQAGDLAPAPDWVVVVYNNDSNTYEEVIVILMLATNCEVEEAYIEAWEIDHHGQCTVHRSSQEECEHAAEIIRSIGIRVEAMPDPLA